MTEQLTGDEIKADLTLEQLQELVGLVEYDATRDPLAIAQLPSAFMGPASVTPSGVSEYSTRGGTSAWT